MKKSKRKTKIIILACAVVILAVAAAIYAQNHRTHQTAQTAAKSASGQAKSTAGKSKGAAAASSPSAPASSSAAPAATSSPGHPISSTLAKPTGEVLSNNPISLANDPGMDSSCNTVPGALCGLQLTGPGGVVKTINPTPTDAEGGNDFTWNAKTLGLTPGSWSVQLLATYNGQSSLSDAYNLTVNP